MSAPKVTAAAAAAAKRRGPGRPPSKPLPPPLEKKGIVDSPTDSNNRLEFVFGEPMVFKSLFTYFKNLKTKEVHLRCSPTGLTFFTRDHQAKSRVVAHVAGEYVNLHYCEAEYWLALNREKLEKMFSAVDKTFFKMTISQTHDDPSTLIFVFKDAEIDKECHYRISVSTPVRDEDLYAAEEELTPDALITRFPIEFTLSEKQFKKTITDISNYSEALTIEKLGAHPLQITYAHCNMVYNEVYRSAEKIFLRSAIDDHTTFRATVKVANVKSLAASMVTDDVRILCREDGDLLFRSALDAKALVVSTLTQLS